MKVLMLNGSPRKEGCTYTALIQIAGVLEKNGIESEIFQAGTPELENVRAAAEKMKEADALIVGSPVYWASPSGQIIEFMDKFCSLAGKDMLLKPAAAIASARRAGTTATLDVLLNTFHSTRCQSFLPTIGIWYTATLRMSTSGQEGIQIMHVLGKNMAWLLHCLEAGKNAGISKPESEEKVNDKLYPLNL